MRLRHQNWVGALWLIVLLLSCVPQAAADGEQQSQDLLPRLQEIFNLRARWLLTDSAPPPLEGDYHPDTKTARWALHHEQSKIQYVQQWAKNRGVRIVKAEPTLHATKLKETQDVVRFYVVEHLALGYVYPPEEQVNTFGVGSRHILELRRRGDQWLIGMEWYSDPLGDDSETPALVPFQTSGAVPPAGPGLWAAIAAPVSGGYNREEAVRYADEYCGAAWGCGNGYRYNPKYRDYSGVGGDCTNFASQVLQSGGLRVPLHTRVEGMAAYLQHSGRASLSARGEFPVLWKEAAARSQGFLRWIAKGDLIAYQEKGKLEHFAVVAGFDSRGYPLVNSHTADRYHVPFDLGWDRKTIYWLFHIHG